MKTYEEMTALSATDKFRFLCSKKNACFNQCCTNVNQILTPYDILRLKKALNLTSGEFLEKYCEQYDGPETGLPIVSLKPNYKSRLQCPFVSEEGCKVYKDRPSSCRLYPLARLASRNRETGKITEHFALIKEEHCKGFEQGKEYTPKEWIKNQEAEEYNKINDMLVEIIGIANTVSSASLNSDIKNKFRMICYDLDTFGNDIFKNNPPDLKPNEDIADIIKTDDAELLKFGLGWLKQLLLNV
ncbi:MAG: YkgJ family cysteine cluster protein [Deltaproteobacteria bacterium]|nr:YkgJ family cysteine cluster protein [Deltaproteobacteria bacterium]